MVKLRSYPSRSQSMRSIFAQQEWNVVTHISSAPSPTSAAARSRISAAALFVNVSARTFHGFTPCSIRFAMRYVSTRVLPLPAPASTSKGPSRHSTAARCSLFKIERSMTGRFPFFCNMRTSFYAFGAEANQFIIAHGRRFRNKNRAKWKKATRSIRSAQTFIHASPAV